MIRSRYLVISLVLGISMALSQGLVAFGEEGGGTDIVMEGQTELPQEPEVIPTPEIIIPEPIIIYRSLGLYAEANPIGDIFTNGDVLRYEVYLSNDGTEVLSGIEVQDDLGLNKKIDTLQPGESITLDGAYRIDDYNRDEIIGNSVDISADFEGEHINLNIDFSVDIVIPKGSITIMNNSDELNEGNEEFDFIIIGPMNTMYSMSLMPGESGTVDELFIGEYNVTTIAPMYYKANSGSEMIELTLEDLDRKVQIECSKLTEAWFTSTSTGVASGNRISSNDLETEFDSYSYVNNRSDDAFIELEPIIIIPEPLMIIPEVIIPVESQPIIEDPIIEDSIIEDSIIEDPIIESEAETIDPEESYFSPATIETDTPEELEILDVPIESEVLL